MHLSAFLISADIPPFSAHPSWRDGSCDTHTSKRQGYRLLPDHRNRPSACLNRQQHGHAACDHTPCPSQSSEPPCTASTSVPNPPESLPLSCLYSTLIFFCLHANNAIILDVAVQTVRFHAGTPEFPDSSSYGIGRQVGVASCSCSRKKGYTPSR